MLAVEIRIGVNSNAFDIHFAQRPDDAHSNLATIGDEDSFNFYRWRSHAGPQSGILPCLRFGLKQRLPLVAAKPRSR